MLHRQKMKPHLGRIGLDIGSHTINAVEVIERGPETIIRSAGSVAIPTSGRSESIEPGAVTQAIKSLWVSAGFRSRQVVVALPPEAVYLKWLHLEAADEAELARTAKAAAARGAPFPANDAVVDYRVLLSRGTVSSNVHLVMLVAASAKAIDNLLNTVEAAGLEPVAVDIGPAAALRTLTIHRAAGGPLWSGQPLAHCIIGARSTTIAVMRGSALEFVRTVPVGGNDFTQCIAESAGLAWNEAERAKTGPGVRMMDGWMLLANHGGEQLRVPCEPAVGRLAREALRSLRFFRSQFAEGSYLGMIGAATLSGGGALLKGLEVCLREQGIEVTGVVNPFAGISVEAEGAGVQHVGDSAPAYTTAVGLAIGDYASAEQVAAAA